MTLNEIERRRINYNNVNNEGGEGYNPYDAIYEAEALRIAALPRWSKEETQAKRVAWNNDIRSYGAGITFAQVRALEVKHGFMLNDLKIEIAKHNL